MVSFICIDFSRDGQLLQRNYHDTIFLCNLVYEVMLIFKFCLSFTEKHEQTFFTCESDFQLWILEPVSRLYGNIKRWALLFWSFCRFDLLIEFFFTIVNNFANYPDRIITFVVENCSNMLVNNKWELWIYNWSKKVNEFCNR